MTDLFLDILSLSISASWLVVAALLLRLLLPKAPKALHVAMWGLVALRLLLPVSLESSLSLVPEPVGSGAVVESWSQTPVDLLGPAIPEEPVEIPTPGVSDLETPGEVLSPPSDLYSAIPSQPTVEQILIPTLARLWALGAVLLSAYAVLSHLVLWWQVRDGLLLTGRVYRSAFAPTAFVLGWFRPRIYVPAAMKDQDLAYVVAHEEAHIARLDHWWKPLGFLLLTVHWFNPLMWLAYCLLCRDIELACDQRVIRNLAWDQRADYSQTLLNCSIHRNMILACPTAFGMTGTKERVKNVLNYKKPGLWISLVTVLAIVVSLVCFFTVPPAQAKEPNPTAKPTTEPTEVPIPTLPGNMVPVVDPGTPHTGSFIQGQAQDEYGPYEYVVTVHSVGPTGLHLFLQTTDYKSYYPSNVYYIEKLTDNGWEALAPRTQEAQIHSLPHRSEKLDGPNLPMSWRGASVDWSTIYGVLEPGTYRFCITLLPEIGESKLQFTIGHPGTSDAAQALLRYYEALDALLGRDSYHLREESPALGNAYEYRHAGQDYLCYGWLDTNQPMNTAYMIRSGVDYRGECETTRSDSPIIGWRQEHSIDLDWFTRWVSSYLPGMNEINAYEETADTIRFRKTNGDILEVRFDAAGALASLRRIPGDPEHSEYILTVLDTEPEAIRSEIYSRNVEFYHAFTDSGLLDQKETLMEREFVNTSPATIETVTQAIDRARKETTIVYNSIMVHYDDARHIWRIDFEQDWGKGPDGTESIYMDENGVTLRITRWPEKI